MAGKIPPDAFEYYVSLGQKRSYEAVAERYQVSKRSVVKRAKREGWQGRILELEARAREKATEKAGETIEEVRLRHLKTFRAVGMKALEGLKAMHFTTVMEVLKGLELSARQELLAFGEPSERTAVSIEEKIRREYERWMVVKGQKEDDDGDTGTG
jgi:ERCC4-type nuclease